MPQLEFARVYDYSGDAESIVLPVVLRLGSKLMRVAASVDTGASFCLFGAEIAEALGLELEGGIPQRFQTANSAFHAFGHEGELTVMGVSTSSLVYFFADPTIDKNVLGRIGWLDRVRFALIHHDSMAYLAPYDQS